MYYFCTYFDHNFLAHGLALYQSLKQNCPAFKLWVLCLDAEAYTVLSQRNLPEVQPVAIEAFERGDAALLKAKQNRSVVEYYFTCTPSLPLFVLKRHSEVDLITYIDADLFFFADPTPLYAEMEGRSIAIIGHRFSTHLRHLETHGVYNVGWLSFRRDQHGMACLQWWRERCLEWCYDRFEMGRYADQKYLDEWPQRFEQVAVLDHKGANLAPYNLANYKLQLIKGQICVDGQHLIFYHFHALKQMKKWLFDSNLASYKVFPSDLVRQHIYAPYIRTMLGASSRTVFKGLRDIGPHNSRLKEFLRIGKRLLMRNYIFRLNENLLQ
jgi:hypothetical protein